MIRALAFVLAFVALGCSAKGVTTPPDPPKPTFRVVIDDAFTPDERAAIARGGDAWATAVGEDLSLAYLVTPRAFIDAALERGLPAATLYFIRLGTSSEIPPDCLLFLQGACYDAQRVWIAAEDVGTLGAWARVPVHEFGHAFGLPHSNALSTVMSADLLSVAYAPSAADVADYCRFHSCPHWSPYPAK